MRIVVVYDNRRSEKLPLFKEQLEKQGITDYEIFPAIVLSHSVIESISASFKEVIRRAKENNDEEICVMEDDIWFPNENGWKYFLENKPSKFDIYISGSYLIDNRFNYKPPLVKVNQYTGNQCVIVSKNYYDVFLSANPKEHIDTAQNDRGDFYLCFPFIGLQRSGFSANCGDVVNYNPVIPKEYIY